MIYSLPTAYGGIIIRPAIGTTKFNITANNDSLRTGLVGYWTMDGKDTGATYTLDSSGNGNTGTLTNGPAPTLGRIGQAINFDGVDDRIDAGSDASLDNIQLQGGGGLSVSAWIYPRTLGEGSLGRIVVKDNNIATGLWHFLLGANNTLSFQKNGSTVLSVISANNSINLQRWQHVLVTWDGSITATNVHIYVNGVETGYGTQINGAGFATDAALQLRIGDHSGGTRSFDGIIDDVRVHNRVLSLAEIKRLYNIGASKFNIPLNNDSLATGLVGRWSFDGKDMAGVTAFDRSGNANNGTLTNGLFRTIGRIGQAINFDGVDAYINIPDTSVVDFGAGDFAFSAWVYNTRQDVLDMVIAKDVAGVGNRQFLFALNADAAGTLSAGAVHFIHFQSSTVFFRRATDAGVVPINTWTHILYRRVSGVGELWVNGQNKNTSTVANGGGTDAGSMQATGSAIRIGARGVSGDEKFFNGKIDEVRIYNRALSVAEIKRLYNIGR